MNMRLPDDRPGRARPQRNQANRGIVLRWLHTRRARGFTLMELLVVIGIMAIVAGISLPAIKSWNKGNLTTSASRQLLDDLAFARQTAISRRSTVYVIFAPPSGNWSELLGRTPALTADFWKDASDLPILTNILNAPYGCYALFVKRQVGDQPGTTNNSQYITQWKTLPEGTFIATNKFAAFTGRKPYPVPPVFNGVRAFASADGVRDVPFPTTTSMRRPWLPCIAFDHLGRLLTGVDEIIPLARGSAQPMRDAQGQTTLGVPFVTENPPFNSIEQSNHIRVDFLTGRARLEKWEMR